MKKIKISKNEKAYVVVLLMLLVLLSVKVYSDNQSNDMYCKNRFKFDDCSYIGKIDTCKCGEYMIPANETLSWFIKPKSLY